MAGYILDGDDLRHGLCSDLGFSAEDRAENIRRAGEIAKMMAEAGLIVVTSLISPFAKDRQRVREICHAAGVVFAEVYINAPLEICEQRDPRKLYQKARAGEIKGFTGIDSPYEPPQKPDLVIKTGEFTVQESLDQLLELVINLSQSDAPLKAEEVLPGTNI
jgi:adenylyl-sulfate kinase